MQHAEISCAVGRYVPKLLAHGIMTDCTGQKEPHPHLGEVTLTCLLLMFVSASLEYIAGCQSSAFVSIVNAS